MGLLTYKDTKMQSQTVYKQFGESKWIPFAKENAKLPRKDSNDLKGCGLGKFLVSCALGESLEEKVESIKKHRDKVDVLTCDKGFGALLERGVKADYVMICDTNVEFKHVKEYIPETKDVKLLCTPYANIEWTSSWKGDRYFYVNKDSIETELVFQEILGNVRMIPAGSNVSNAMVVFFMGVDEKSRYNWSAYEMVYLVGYDYSWRPNGNYYSWANPVPKRYYMSHRTLLDINKDWCFTSENLFFSAKWLTQYATSFDIPIMNCSGRGLLQIKRMGDLEEELSRIVSNKYVRDSVKRSYDLLCDARTNYEKAKQNFTKTREGLIQWPLETKLELA